MQPIPVICDRCRADGVGEDPFEAFGALLDFEPVPKAKRADGWDEECQRAFDQAAFFKLGNA
jgi:hypothetical protein